MIQLIVQQIVKTCDQVNSRKMIVSGYDVT